MKSRSDHRVIELLLSEGPLDRPGLAERAQLSRPSTTELIERLVKSGLVEEDGEVPNGRRGPNAMRYRLSPGRGSVAALEIQPDHADIVLADVDGTELEHRRLGTRRNEKPATLVRRAVKSLSDVRRLAAVVVGTPGVVDRDGTVVHVADHPHWIGPQRSRMEESLGIPVALENDTNLIAVAEHRYGVAVGVADFVLVRSTESLSSGLILDGRLVRGAHGAAGEIGFHPYGQAGEGLADQLVAAVIGLCAVVDPSLAVLSGPDLTVDLAADVERRIAETSLFRPRVRLSGLENGAVTRGALALALEMGRERVYFG